MHALHSLRVLEQRAPATRVAIFSPSVCLSAVGFVRLQRRPSAPHHRHDPELPSARCGASDEIIAHVVMDADFLYSSLFPHVNIRHWLAIMLRGR